MHRCVGRTFWVDGVADAMASRQAWSPCVWEGDRQEVWWELTKEGEQ